MLALSLLPLILFTIFVFLGKFKLIWSSLTSLFLTLFLVIFVWQMQFSFINASFLKGIFVATDILIIIFGALFFLGILKNVGIIDSLCFFLKKISPDYRIQVILLAWFLENFLEGTAGFGTPSTVVAPLLVGVGLPPIIAVAVALLGNSASVVFGAAGTPIRVGFAGLDTINVPFYSAAINIVGFLVPVFILWVITSWNKEKIKVFLEALPFAIFSGLAFVVPSFFLVSLGQEFPSIMGSIIGFLITLFFIKFKIFIPKNVRILRKEQLREKKFSVFKTVSPYIFLITLLIIEKFVLNNFGFIVSFEINHAFNLFNPGLALILAAIPTVIFWRIKKDYVKKTIAQSFKKAIEPFLIIASISVMVQLMVNSQHNSLNMMSMLQTIANGFESKWLPLFAPAIGAFGSFLTGSATISNIMFGSILQSSSSAMGLSVSIILSLQVVGASAGNMIALADILPAQAVVGLKGQERNVIKRVIIPCTIYFLLAGIIGLLIA